MHCNYSINSIFMKYIVDYTAFAHCNHTDTVIEITKLKLQLIDKHMMTILTRTMQPKEQKKTPD